MLRASLAHGPKSLNPFFQKAFFIRYAYNNYRWDNEKSQSFFSEGFFHPLCLCAFSVLPRLNSLNPFFQKAFFIDFSETTVFDALKFASQSFFSEGFFHRVSGMRKRSLSYGVSILFFRRLFSSKVDLIIEKNGVRVSILFFRRLFSSIVFMNEILLPEDESQSFFSEGFFHQVNVPVGLVKL